MAELLRCGGHRGWHGKIYLELFLISAVQRGCFLSRMTRKTEAKSYDETISEKGFRFTEQRRQVYEALMAQRDHPTAVEVFMRVKPKLPTISLATVYNTLETLAGCGLVKHVNHEREPSRYCANPDEHAHLFCEKCGSVTDLPMRSKRRPAEMWELPENAIISGHEVSFHGLCPKCAMSAEATPKAQSRK
jgi:Fur family peroxide stress response transcriptional regulator